MKLYGTNWLPILKSSNNAISHSLHSLYVFFDLSCAVRVVEYKGLIHLDQQNTRHVRPRLSDLTTWLNTFLYTLFG